MVKYYQRNGKLTKFGIKEHNEYLQEGIRQLRLAIDQLKKCEMKETDRHPMIEVLEGYISSRESKLIDMKGNCNEKN